MARSKQRDGIQERRAADGTITFRAQVRLRGHAAVSKTFSRKTDAKQWVEATKTSIRRGDLPSGEADRTTLKEALERYLREVTPLKKDREREGNRVKAWMTHPLAVRFLSKLRGADFASYRDARRRAGKAENTIALELKLISHVFKIAASDWGMEGLRNPIKNVAMPGGSRKRDRRLVGDEEQRLTAELGKTPYMRELAELAIETAMRQSELLSLTRALVDLDARVAHLADTKNGERRDVPLSPRAVEIIRGLPRQIREDAPIFPMSQDFVIRTFRAACTAAKIANLKFHDLRHEATTRLGERLAMHELQRVTGHKTLAMLSRYYHPRPEDLARKLALGGNAS